MSQRKIPQNKRERYQLYTGNNIQTVSLWVRRDGKEYPIYANTRGQCEWYSHRPDVYENTNPHSLSDTFVEWLAHFYKVKEGLIDRDGMFLADAAAHAEPEQDPKWYETEILNHIDQPGMTPEQEELLEWAYQQVQE
jgi:hypothetical protein